MGINSTEVAYNFGQLGSAISHSKIVPPKDHVIIAITTIHAQIFQELTPERLDEQGPNFPFVSTGNVTLLADPYGSNSSGVVTLALNDNAGSDINPVVLTAGANAKVKPGQFVIMVNDTAQTDGNPANTYDAQTPSPIYNGPNQQGVKVKSIDGANITLEGHGNTSFSGLSPDSQALIFLDEYHGAGNVALDACPILANTTIFGRWASVTPQTGHWVAAYFGK